MKAIVTLAVFAGFLSICSLAWAINCPQGQSWSTIKNACVSNIPAGEVTSTQDPDDTIRDPEMATQAGANAALNGGNGSVGVSGDSAAAISSGISPN